MDVGGVVLAAGYGVLDGRSKVLATINGIPLVCRAVRTLKLAGVGNVQVVLNPRNQLRVRAALKQYGCAAVSHTVQLQRGGTAEATALAAESLCSQHVVVLLADTPLVRSESVRLLVAHHQSRSVMTVGAVRLLESVPNEVRRGYRIVQDNKGLVECVGDVRDLGNAYHRATLINASVYVLNSAWLLSQMHTVPVRDKRDGYTPERRLPSLVELAHREGRPANVVILPGDPRQVLGVNDEQQFRLVRKIAACLD